MPKAKAAKAKSSSSKGKAKPASVKTAAGKSAAKTGGRPATSPKPKAGKWVYSFGDGRAEGRADMRNTLGGKGANLAEMASLGLPVPPGFTITTDVCNYF